MALWHGDCIGLSSTR